MFDNPVSIKIIADCIFLDNVGVSKKSTYSCIFVLQAEF